MEIPEKMKWTCKEIFEYLDSYLEPYQKHEPYGDYQKGYVDAFRDILKMKGCIDKEGKRIK